MSTNRAAQASNPQGNEPIRGLKVLVIAPHAYYVDRGSPIDVDILLRALSARGVEVQVCVYHEGDEREYPGVTIQRIRPPKWLSGIGPGPSGRKLLADLYLFGLTWRVARQFEPDVVHAGEESVFFARVFKALLGIPYVYDMDSSIAQQLVERMPFLKLLAPALNACERHAIRNAIACAPVCNALADVAHRAGAKHVETLHDISQLSDPCRGPTGFLRERLGIADGRLLLMYVGNLQPYQGVDLLLAGYAVAIELGARVDLVIVGGSDAHIAAYHDRARSMGLDGQVHFLGRWPAAKLDELLVEADMLTAPRIQGVNTPQKIFPYMHSGRPVLLTDLPTHSQIVDGSVACLAPPNPEGFGRAIASLASDTEGRKALGAAGRAFVERNHTFPAHQRRVDRLYEYVASGLKRRPAGTVGRRRLIDHPTGGEG